MLRKLAAIITAVTALALVAGASSASAAEHLHQTKVTLVADENANAGKRQLDGWKASQSARFGTEWFGSGMADYVTPGHAATGIAVGNFLYDVNATVEFDLGAPLGGERLSIHVYNPLVGSNTVEVKTYVQGSSKPSKYKAWVVSSTDKLASDVVIKYGLK